jgi:membrane protein DedA with SNARE-associated domain
MLTKKIFYVLGGFCVLVMGMLSYAGIAILMGIESACIPLPSELIMPYAGALSDASVSAALLETYKSVGLTSLPQFNLWLAALAGAIGCNLGSELAYWVGAKGGRPAIERYGRYVLMSKHELAIADRWFAKRGDIIILVARLLPVIRTFIAFPAGVARMNRTKFHIYTFVGSFPWCLGLAYVGQRLGVELLDEHSPLKRAMHKFDAVIVAVVVIAAAVFIWSRLKNLKSYREEGAAPPPESAAAKE